MRALAVVLCGSLLSGCSVNSYQIPPSELARLVATPPEVRGAHVRVIQEIVASEAPAATPVNDNTQLVLVPQINISGSVNGGPHAGGGLHGGFGKIGGAGNDGKALAIAVIVLAVTAMITAAAIEGSRFDGWARLHPMHPVHLVGHDGTYNEVPLAWLDATWWPGPTRRSSGRAKVRGTSSSARRCRARACRTACTAASDRCGPPTARPRWAPRGRSSSAAS